MQTCPRCGASLTSDVKFCPYDGARLGHQTGSTLIGSTLDGRYDIVEFIGAGGNAQVYKAWHHELGAHVALKILDGQDPRRIARFALEARAVSRIDHENIVSVLDFGYGSGGICYIALEYVPGRPLNAEIERLGWISAARAVHILAQIAAGVGRAHEMGIVHRDLKPDNVMLTTQRGDADFVKVLDFGLARAMEPSDEMPRLTRTGEIFGTPAFMAPEQWRGDTIDARTDVYAIGALGYQMVTGRLPFEAPSIAKMMHLHLNEAPVPPRKIAPEVTAGLETVVLRALAKDADRRFQTASDLLGALQSVWEGFTPPSGRTTYGRAGGSLRPGAVSHQQNLSVDMDGPHLCASVHEIVREREQHTHEIVEKLWGTTPSTLVQLLRPVENEVGAIAALARAVGSVRERMDTTAEQFRQEWAALRGEIVDLHVALDVERQLLESDSVEMALPPEGEEDEPTRPMEYSFHLDGMPRANEPDLETQRRDAERRLAESRARSREIAADLRAELVAGLREFIATTERLQETYEQLVGLVQRRIDERALPRSTAVELEASHGAIEAYVALLKEMIRHASVPRRVPSPRA